MSESTLYRKYRPKDFSQVMGQDHVIKALSGAIKNKTVSHAYLFSGSRGIGKTSIARIFAHNIGTSDNDIYEIDAASNRKIEHVRELRDAVNTLPMESEYKVYIIDEVHMLTKESFNALLKTLEEPPAHVIFILATTEADRMPETIISRCQTFYFKRPNHKVLQGVIRSVAEAEGYTLEDSAVSLIALLADGSFRDANGVLQKVLSSTSSKKKNVTVEYVEEVTGAPRSDLVNTFLRAVAKGEIDKALESVEGVVATNGDMRIFAELILHRLRFILLLRYAPTQRETIAEDLSDDDLDVLEDIAHNKDSKINSQTLDVFLEAYGDMKLAYLPQLPLEIALFKTINQE